MLEFFRRHRGAFLITLTASIIISMFYYGVSQTTASHEKKLLPTDVALTVYGKDYTVADVQRVQRSVQFSNYLQSEELTNIMGILPSSGGLDAFGNFFVARHLMEELGIRPSNEEARAALDKLPALQNNGKLDVSRGQMLEQIAASMGFDSEALLDIMKDIIGLRKLQDLVTKSYTASPLSAEKQYASSYQTFKGSTIVFETETFKKAATVTDDEIKKYYEENKENYKTVEKRAVSYVFFEKAKDLDKVPFEQRQKAQNAPVERVNAFNALTNAKEKRKTFVEAAAAMKEKIETVPAFAQGNPPDALKAESDLVEQIFARPKDSTSPAEAVEGSKGWYVFEVTKVEEPKQQELAEVTGKIKEVLLGQKADEARTKAVNEARLALSEGLKAGKKIEDLVKAQKLTLQPLPDIDIANPPQEVSNSFYIAQEAAMTAVGSISHAVDIDNGKATLLVYVSAKELRKRPDSAELRKNQVQFLSDRERARLFQAWFKKQHEAARISFAKLG
ncbi:MAG: peptidyl-prolyl cis-trans isomerase [Prosthecobacter sp.]|uniref:peptidylprolyl isomerase n=1 Tax=Prosthecobacter sp. TaxID=1965333 RepID=UPI0025CE22C2|nr:peptidyl-prolyl cis-trans isomerase [Prosthecobacter sp.]MCF7787464.1 peptidyl-prolyl cis-trans isomerase [Prosthecobacter sp.]